MSVCRAGERTIGLKMKPCTSVDIPGLDRLRPVCGEQQVSGGLLFKFVCPPHRQGAGLGYAFYSEWVPALAIFDFVQN